MVKGQQLYWSASKPLRWIGLTIDEWGLLLGGVIPGLAILNIQKLTLGIALISFRIFSCYTLKKLSEDFLLKSYLLFKGLIFLKT
jgi:hypothetical protein